MRILLVTTYFEPDSGAAAVRLSRLAKQLAERGHAVTVLTAMPHYPRGEISDGYRGRYTMTEMREGVRVVRAWLYANNSPKILQRLMSQISFMLTALLRGLFLPRPEVVLIEAQPVFTSLAGTLLARLKRAPYVLNVSDIWPEYLEAVGVMRSTHPLYRLFKFLVNRTERGAAGIVALLPSILESIRARIGDGTNRRVIFNAVDLRRFHTGLDDREFREKYGLGDARLITFVGTFGTHIDFSTMLEAAACFAGRDDVRFVFIGTGRQREKIEERLARGDLHHTIWIGWIDHDEMPYAWAASYLTYWAIYDHPLYRGSLQSKFFEAMASGVPVVIALEGIATETVNRSGAGITVPFGSTQALADAIERLLNDAALRATYSAAARRYAEQHFDAERVADAYEAVLTGVIRAR